MMKALLLPLSKLEEYSHKNMNDKSTYQQNKTRKLRLRLAIGLAIAIPFLVYLNFHFFPASSLNYYFNRRTGELSITSTSYYRTRKEPSVFTPSCNPENFGTVTVNAWVRLKQSDIKRFPWSSESSIHNPEIGKLHSTYIWLFDPFGKLATEANDALPPDRLREIMKRRVDIWNSADPTQAFKLVEKEIQEENALITDGAIKASDRRYKEMIEKERAARAAP